MHASKQANRLAAMPLPRLAVVASLTTLGLGACSSSTDPNVTGASDITARIDGAQWGSTQAAIATVPNAPGWYVITGTEIMGNQGTTIVITLYNVDGPGTYVLGVGPTSFGGIANFVETSGGWSTPLSGASGTITITALTASRMAAEFSFTAEPLTGGAVGTRTVTNGEFDLEFPTTNPLTPVPDHVGSLVSATVGGAAWNAATIAVAASANTFVMSTSNNLRTISIALGSVSGPGSYSIGSVPNSVAVLGPGDAPQSNPCCWNEAMGNTGTVTIATMSATRVTGTFSATLAPTPGSGASAPLTITGGTFDVGLPQPSAMRSEQ